MLYLFRSRPVANSGWLAVQYVIILAHLGADNAWQDETVSITDNKTPVQGEQLVLNITGKIE